MSAINREREARLSHAALLEALDYSPSTGEFRWRRTSGGAIRGRLSGTVLPATGYVRVGVCHDVFQAHRLAWFYVHGVWPAAEIDHIDGCKTNNRIANLRQADRAQNQMNIPAHVDSPSGIKGVAALPSGRWRACICMGGRLQHLGVFDRMEDASMAYAGAARQMAGQFARQR